MHHALFVQTFQDRTGVASAETAERSIQTALEVLGQCLIDMDRRALAARLPSPLAAVIKQGRYESDCDLDQLFERIRQRDPAANGAAVEHAQVVFQLVGECLDSDTRTLLQKHLPNEVADLFAVHPRTTGSHPRVEPRAPIQSRTPTLSEGRPGSFRSLAEATDASAQRGSIARSENPHADTKLSSSRDAG